MPLMLPPVAPGCPQDVKESTRTLTDSIGTKKPEFCGLYGHPRISPDVWLVVGWRPAPNSTNSGIQGRRWLLRKLAKWRPCSAVIAPVRCCIRWLPRDQDRPPVRFPVAESNPRPHDGSDRGFDGCVIFGGGVGESPNRQGAALFNQGIDLLNHGIASKTVSGVRLELAGRRWQ